MLSLSNVSALHRGVLCLLVWNSLDSRAASSASKLATNGWWNSWLPWSLSPCERSVLPLALGSNWSEMVFRSAKL
jgi:hypothetical protein